MLTYNLSDSHQPLFIPCSLVGFAQEQKECWDFLCPVQRLDLVNSATEDIKAGNILAKTYLPLLSRTIFKNLPFWI